MNTTFERLRAVIADTLSIEEDQVQLTSHYQNELGCDSLDLAELQFQTEKEFKVDIPDAIAESQQTVQATVTYLDSLRK
jgi:acyl carrier protein